jgi:hypothetical protein
MVHPSVIEARIDKLGFKHSRWFKAEINELQHVLMDNEKIIVLACGRYFGSFALLVATDQRLLLIDKRMFFMTIEDTRYDMISEINYNTQLYSANVTVYTINKTHKFTSIKHRQQLRDLTNYVQKRVMEFRQQQPSDTSTVPDSLRRTQSPAVNDQRFNNFSLSLPTDQADEQSAGPVAVSHSDSRSEETLDQHRLRVHLGNAAHLVGSAATRAAHGQPELAPHAFHPYIQGSLMTRGSVINSR